MHRQEMGSSTFVFKVLVGITMILFVGSCIGTTEEEFTQISCKGVFVPSFFKRLNRICQECSDLFRELNLYNNCRKNCFKNDFFEACYETLMVDDGDENTFEKMADRLAGSLV